MAAGGMQALGVWGADAGEVGFGTDTVFRDGFEPALPSGAMRFTVSAPTRAVLGVDGPGSCVPAWRCARGQQPGGEQRFAAGDAAQCLARRFAEVRTAGVARRGGALRPRRSSSSAGTAGTGTPLTLADLQATGIVASIGCGSIRNRERGPAADWATPFLVAPGQGGVGEWSADVVVDLSQARRQRRSPGGLAGGSALRRRGRRGSAVDRKRLPARTPPRRTKAAAFTFTSAARSGSLRRSTCSTARARCCSAAPRCPTGLASDPDVTIKHAMKYFMSTDLVPSYLADVPTHAGVLGTQVTSFVPLQQGNWPTGMGGRAAVPASACCLNGTLYLTCAYARSVEVRAVQCLQCRTLRHQFRARRGID